MNIASIGLILVSVSFSVLAQILLKHGMSNPAVQASFSSGIVSGVTSILTNIFVLCGLFSYVSSAAIWLGVLAKVDVSKAYPFVGLGFIGTMLFAYWFLNEPLTIHKATGTLLILIGVFLISK
ncbi:Multidrug Resistance protein (plasmid) [Vibrio sp. B1REV9]|uniref:EamA family transporter n=1 Tax=Vibrio sp. B1REV9 TaxID=2751179 RepID=UPI001AED11F9|nr:EamA family transporter [Vibrio sp. B1REV9]CAE6957197.1 Multidrug Resistance protein [Vibrio sp. B1REV9]